MIQFPCKLILKFFATSKNVLSKAKKIDVILSEVLNLSKIIEELIHSNSYKTNITEYLTSYIQYEYDDAKKQAMNLFLKYGEELELT